MTDEELRQQYGIQLAERPLEGADSNIAKWADLEDEDEDWAPETLEWNDGTKINLAPAEPTTPATPQINLMDKAKEEKDSAPVEEPAAAPKSLSLGPKATVLKLGGGANQLKLALATPGASPAPKSTNDKLTLVAKPSPAPPAKSPWAQLPPVEKVSPVVPTAQQQPASRFTQRESYSRESGPPLASQPTREIAADDYSRFTGNGTPRELFNSQSGRYEPAPESRRAAGKKESGFRAPAVLQRPSQNDATSPAEPSAAFQTFRNQQDTNTWRRRRASSNVSGESGAFVRRMSISRPDPEGFGRRDSMNEQAIVPEHGLPHSENRIHSPAISNGVSATSQSPMVSSSAIATRSDQSAGNQAPETPATATFADDLARQKVMMKEKAEAAMKRRKEEEAREEAEKRERLRLKLAQLEQSSKPVPEAQPSKEIPSTQIDSLKTPPVAQPSTTKALSPPKPPVPVASGEPQQYGLMKVHSVSTTSHPTGGESKQPVSNLAAAPRNSQVHVHGNEQRASVPNANLISEQVPIKPIPSPIGHPFNREQPLQQQTHRLPSQPPSAGYPNPVWSQGSMTTHSAPGVNVWAAPGSLKTLGNGDFNKSATQIHLPPVTSEQYPQHLAQAQPQPIGTPRQLQGQPVAPQATNHHQIQPHSFASNTQIPNQPKAHQQLPVMPKDHTLPANMSARPPGISAWNNFAKNAPAYDAKKKAQMVQESAAIAAEREQAGLSAHQPPVLHETWTQVARGDTLGTRHTVTSTLQQHDFTAGENAVSNSTQTPHVRSRYQDLFDQNERVAPAFTRPREPLTPPPEEGDHPVFFGGAERPKVRLPGSLIIRDIARPTPIVRLPPVSQHSMNHNSVSMLSPGRLPLSPVRFHPLVANPTWQERINGLIRGTQSSDKKPVEIPGFSVSKEPLEYADSAQTAVALPQPETNALEPLNDKDVEEETALFEEGREFGSVPAVCIPDMAPRMAWTPAKAFNNVVVIKRAILPRFGSYSADIFVPGYIEPSKIDIWVWVRMPSMSESKRFRLLLSSSSSPNIRAAKNRKTSGQHNNGGRNREDTAVLASPSPNPVHNKPSPVSGRPPHRGSGSRKVSVQGHNSSWSHAAKRTGPAPAVVH